MNTEMTEYVEPLTLVEAGVRMGINPRSLAQQIRAGKLRAKKRGRQWFVTIEAIEEYEREHKGKQGPVRGSKKSTKTKETLSSDKVGGATQG